MKSAYTSCYTPIGDFGPTAEQRRDQNQLDCPHGMKQQHNSSLSFYLDKKEAHGGAAALCRLATLSAAADPLPVSSPPYSSSWASSLLAANHGTFFEGDRCPPVPNLPPMPLCTFPRSASYIIPRLVRTHIHGRARARRTTHDCFFHFSFFSFFIFPFCIFHFFHRHYVFWPPAW